MTTNQSESVSIHAQLQSLKIIVGSMGAALVLVGAIGTIVLPSVSLEPVHLLLGVAIGAVGGLGALALQKTLLPPLAKDEPNPVTAGMGRLRAVTMTQIALCESSGLVLFALGFVFDLNAIAVLLGMLVSAAFAFAVVWPGTERLRRVSRRLEENGARCPLDELAARRG